MLFCDRPPFRMREEEEERRTALMIFPTSFVLLYIPPPSSPKLSFAFYCQNQYIFPFPSSLLYPRLSGIRFLALPFFFFFLLSSSSFIDPALIGDKKCNVPSSFPYLCIYLVSSLPFSGICERGGGGEMDWFDLSLSPRLGRKGKNCISSSFYLSFSSLFLSSFCPRPKAERELFSDIAFFLRPRANEETHV